MGRKQRTKQLSTSGDALPVFLRWQGVPVALYSYSISHLKLQLRLVREWNKHYLIIECSDVKFITGPTKWEQANFTLDFISANEVILSDEPAQFEVLAGAVMVYEVIDR